MSIGQSAHISYAQNRADTFTAQAGRRKDELKEVCQEFESIFIKQMLDSMRKTVTKTGLNDGGMAEEIFEDMLYDKYAAKMSKTADFGIADTLYNQYRQHSDRDFLNNIPQK